MIINEYKLVRNNDRHPLLKVCKSFDYDTNIFNTPYEVATLMVEAFHMNELFVEYAYVLGFDSCNRLLGIIEVGHESDINIKIAIRELFIGLLLLGSNNFVFVHNHPGNILEASINDINLTNKLLLNANLLEIVFRDSIIVCDESYLSLKNEGVF